MVIRPGIGDSGTKTTPGVQFYSNQLCLTNRMNFLVFKIRGGEQLKQSLLKILLFITVILAVAAGPLSAQQIADLEHIASAYKVPVLYGRFTASSYARRYAKWDYLTDKDTTELKAFAVVSVRNGPSTRLAGYGPPVSAGL